MAADGEEPRTDGVCAGARRAGSRGQDNGDADRSCRADAAAATAAFAATATTTGSAFLGASAVATGERAAPAAPLPDDDDTGASRADAAAMEGSSGSGGGAAAPVSDAERARLRMQLMESFQCLTFHREVRFAAAKFTTSTARQRVGMRGEGSTGGCSRSGEGTNKAAGLPGRRGAAAAPRPCLHSSDLVRFAQYKTETRWRAHI